MLIVPSVVEALKMNISDKIAILALVVSLLSLAVSIYFQYRDRVKLKTTCTFYPAHPDYDRAHLAIRIVNHGRRPTLLTLFGGNLKDGKWQGTRLGQKDKAVRLGEHEFNTTLGKELMTYWHNPKLLTSLLNIYEFVFGKVCHGKIRRKFGIVFPGSISKCVIK